MTPAQAKQYLDSFINYENNFKEIHPRTFKLERVRELLRRIDFPIDGCSSNIQTNQKTTVEILASTVHVSSEKASKSRIIHVAGTKGKGSTCVFIASILSAAGYKVGLYTSPHLSDFKERIRILKLAATSKKAGDAFAGKITERDFARTLTQMKPAIEQLKSDVTLGVLSYFEVLTVLAVYYFSRKKVDFIVLETGLGGRLDATNALESCICALTPISLEHTQQLGSTIEAIAGEKAAIIKDKNQIAVIAPQTPSAKCVIKNRLKQCGVKSVWMGKDIRYKSISQQRPKQIFRLKTSTNDYPRLETKLLGEHQLINAAVAVGVVEALGCKILKSAVARGIANAQWPGRFEIFGKNPFVILDGAHNPVSARALLKTVQKIFPGKKVILILGISEDKDKNGIAKALNQIAKEIIFTQADHPRAGVFNDEELKSLFPGKNIVRTQKVKEALKEALNRAGKDDIILICGSLFVVGEARELLCTKSII